MVCQAAQDAHDFHYLKVPVDFLKNEFPNFYVRKNGKVSFFLSAERHEMFAEKRGSGKVSFARFLKLANLTT